MSFLRHISVMVFIIAMSVISTYAFAAKESFGQVSVTDLLIQPLLLVSEPQEAQFQLGNTSLQARWTLDGHFESRFRLGPMSMRNIMGRFNDTKKDQMGIVEGYGQYNSVYGRLRAGLIPIDYAAEGALPEGELFFPRSLFYEQKVLPLRDLGASYRVQNKGYFSEFAAHNGEGEVNPDGRMWFAAKWGWKDREKFEVGFAGLTGTTKPISTTGVTDTLAGVDVSKPSRWRMGTFFLRWYPSEWKVLLEGHMGEVEQDDKTQGKFSGGHGDLIYDTSRWAVMVRWDYFEPNNRVNNDLKREGSLGVIWKNKSQTSQLRFIGKKIVEDGKQEANDEFRIIWQLTPLASNSL